MRRGAARSVCTPGITRQRQAPKSKLQRMLVVERNVPLHPVLPTALGLGRGIPKGVDVRHEKLKHIAPAGGETRISGGAPRTFFLRDLRQTVTIVGGGSRIGAAMNERHVVGIAVVVDALKEV